MHPTTLIRSGALFLLVGTAGAWAAADVAAGGAATPTQVLFMGTDISIQQGKKFYRVEDVDGSEFVIKVAGENKFVRTRMRTNNLKTHPGLKLSPVSVRLDELRGEAGYTPANDPRHKFDRESGAAGGAAAVQDLAYGAMINASLTASLTSAAAASAAGGGGAGATQAAADAAQLQLSDAQRQLDVSSQMTMQDRYNIGVQANRMMLELDEGNFDMVDVSFKISSPVELDDPYMVVLVEFLPRDAKPGETGLLIHAKELDPIGTRPKYIRIREGGMPVGFKFLSQEVHIYNRGKEVATNVSSRRVELDRDEAREYLLIEHLFTHKGDNVPAAAVPGSLPPDTRTRLAPDQLQRVCYAKVAKDGKLLGVYVDESTNLPLPDPAVTALMAEAFFKPALVDGKPVDGIVRVRLADLTL